MAETDPEPQWKKIRLSLERPHRDDVGQPIPTLYDLTPEGHFVFEPKETPSARLETTLRRIFQERGTDFFDKEKAGFGNVEAIIDTAVAKTPVEDADSSDINVPKPMTMEELFNMKSEILPQLFVALGEMSHARDLLHSILSNDQNPQPQNEPSSSSSSAVLSATLVTKPPPIASVQTFNAQVTIGSKDEALRKAAGMFKSAAESMERSRLQGEKYWVDALRIRRANWGLSPAPLPMGSTIGKGADKTSKDFVISYGLEGSPHALRRRAVAHLSAAGDGSSDIIFPYRQNTRLRISISIQHNLSTHIMSFDSASAEEITMALDGRLRFAQTEAIDQEIFSILVKEASRLPTASARVSERLIAIDAAQGMDLMFELVDTTTAVSRDQSNERNICSLIYHVLRVFLLRRHNLGNFDKGYEGSHFEHESSYAILQPVIDILQYRGFCERVEAELRRVFYALKYVGIPSTLSFNAVGEPGELIVSLLSASDKKKTVGGEAVIRIDNWNTLWFTFVSPSTLTAHLPQATLTVLSLPQLSQLLMDEIERCLLQRICQLGRELCDVLGGIWFIDMNRCVARWEGCLLNFRIFYDEDFKIGCSAFRLDSSTGMQGHTRVYDSGKQSLLAWATDVIKESSSHP